MSDHCSECGAETPCRIDIDRGHLCPSCDTKRPRDPTYEIEAELKRQLQALQREYQDRAKPIIDMLVNLESLRSRPPVVFDVSNLSPEAAHRLMEELSKLGRP